MHTLVGKKPKALVVASPFEGRIGYFLAGLSHFFQLEVLFLADHQFSKKEQIFYSWLYAKDATFKLCTDPRQVFKLQETYDYFFFHSEPFNVFSNIYGQQLNFFAGKAELLEYLKQVKQKIPKLYYIEMAEIFFFGFTNPEFWKLVDGVIKHHVFKQQFAYLIREDAKNFRNFKFNSQYLAQNRELMENNSVFEAEQYYHKIFPLPFPPSLTDRPKSVVPLNKRLYDIAGNFRAMPSARYALAQAVEKACGQTYGCAMDYDDSYRANRTSAANFFNPLLTGKWKITRLLSKIFYGKYYYPKMLYVKHLKQARCYLGPGLFFSSYRTADAWSYGSVLINWSFDKIDYGVPLIDGYNYVSLGEREELSPDNVILKADVWPAVWQKLETVLKDRQKQEQIVQNQFKTYQEYFSSPKQMVKKIFIEKIFPNGL